MSIRIVKTYIIKSRFARDRYSDIYYNGACQNN